jgi:phenylacetate-CoA ligase
MTSAPDGAFYAPGIQTLPRERIRALQEERLRRQVARVFERPIPFHARRFADAGATAGDVRTLEDLARIPPVTKDALRESEAMHPPFGDYRGAGVSECVRLGASTGTSGTPTLVLWTRKDLEVDYAASARGRWRWGLRPGMSLAQAHPYGLNAGGWMFSRGIERMGVFNIPCGPPVGERHKRTVAEILRKVKPQRYRLFGNAAEQYGEAARALGYDPASDLGLEIAGDHPSQQYLSVSSGLESLPLLGTACDERDGCHVCEDLAIVEVIDPQTGRARGHGQRGNLVVTVLEKDNFQLRYDLEDVVRWNDEPCPCGETHRRLFYEGRARDLVTAGDRRLLPIDVALVLYDVPEVSTPSAEYQIVRRANDTRALHLRVEFDPRRVGDVGELRRSLALRFRERHGVESSIELVPRGELPRFAYKAARVIDGE